MRLWHEDLIAKLPRQQLLGQHRECCALRGKGWGKKHATVQYVFKYAPIRLYHYHMKVIREMKRRGYQNDPQWENPIYRGKGTSAYRQSEMLDEPACTPIYPEHDSSYLQECMENLEAKGIDINGL